MKMRKSIWMVLTAIAVGFVLGDTLSQKYNITNAFEYLNVFCASVTFTFLVFYVANEIYYVIEDKKSDKDGEANRGHITYHNCSRERKIKELEKQRNEFFDNYFRESSIEMKTRR